VLTKIKIFSRSILVTLIATNLIACGGGGGGSLPATLGKDIKPPFIVETIPASEQIGIKTNAFIDVRFNEDIVGFDTNQVDIYPYDANGVLSTVRIELQQAPFSFNDQTFTLSIKPMVNELQVATKYQVTISDVKDVAGNIMVGSCIWNFGTVDYKKFGIGNTGVCNTPPPIAPDDPTNVRAVAGDGSVAVSWQAATKGAEVTYYKVEKSINNAQSFTTVNANISPAVFIFTDDTAQNDTTYIYRVSAGNDFDISNGINSNPVTPLSNPVTVVPGTPLNVKAVAADTTATINWLAPGTGGKVAFYKVEKSVNSAAYVLVKDKIPSTSLSLIDKPVEINSSHIYRVTAKNVIGFGDGGLSNSVRPILSVPTAARVELISETPGPGNYFGETMVFSPDGNTLVIGEHYGDPASTPNGGTVQVFTKTDGIWGLQQTIIAQQALSLHFGYSLAISQDGSTLAIGTSTSNFVELYTKSTTSWVFSQKLLPNGMNSSQFGRSVAFHPNSALLAIGDSNATVNTVLGAGQVQLFTRSNINWSFSQTITSQSQSVTQLNFFGSQIVYSPDGTTLAVSEQDRDGNVQLFTQSVGNWTLKKILRPNKKPTYGFGGGTNNISFSTDSNTLAIGEFGNNNVQLFIRTAGNWAPGQILAVVNAIGKFGTAVAFSADAGTIAISERDGINNGLNSAGNVYLFNKPGTTWILDRILTAAVPTQGNFFGSSLFFSTITKELAIGEQFGDTAAVKNAGLVTIIDLSKLP